MNKGDNALPDRDERVDIVKTIAIICVISIHVSSYGWDIFPIGSFSWIVNMFWGSLTRAAVPLFLMCSGALFIDPDRELPIKRLYTRYLPRVIVAMFIWSMAYKVDYLYHYQNITMASLWYEFKRVLVFNQEFHLYYIHIIILVYVFLPIVRVFVFNADKKQLRYALVIWGALGILYPTLINFKPISLIAGFPRQWMLNMSYAAIGYLVLGYYLKNISTWVRNKFALILISGFLIVFCGTWYSCAHYGYFVDIFLGGMSVGVALMAMGIYGVCPKKGSRISAWVSKASFCIYLSHVFFLHAFVSAGFSVDFITPIISVPIITIAIFACSSVVYVILSKIPVVNRWII